MINAAGRRAAWGLLVLAPLLAGGLALQHHLRRPTVAKAHAFYAAQPQHLRPIPYSPTPAGLKDVSAESCGACHTEIYAEWKVSTHARAWLDDAQFQEELKKARNLPGRDASWMCANCHTPQEAQLPRLVAELEGGDHGRPVYVDNPRFDPALQLEAISCGTCHVRDGVVLGPFGNTLAPHPVRKAPELLSSQVCLDCHQVSDAFADIEMACMFDTGGELAAGPDAQKTCQQCHMPEITRGLTPNSRRRKTRRHWFGGSLIPKHPRFEAELAPVREHYPDGLAVRWKDLPEAVKAGEAVTLTVEFENAEAGHRLPTGDPERFLLIDARVRDATGAVVAELKERIGSVYDWDFPVTLISDNRLAPREVRTLTLSFTAPPVGPLTLELEASKWRLTDENLQYHELEGRAVPGRVFFEDERPLTVR